MRTLECGCELSADGQTFLSLCHDHGQHMRARAEAAKHPRHDAKAPDEALERELVKIVTPVVLSRWSTVTDANSTAEAIFQHVKAIMARLE